MENVRLHRRGGADAHECTKFGDIVTVDTMVLHGLKDRGVNGETDAVVFYDLATKYIDVLPVFSRSVPNTVEAFHKFMGPEPKIGLLYSDQAREFLAATRRMAWVHHMSTPGMPKTNGIIENKVKLVLHGARVLLRQAGLSPKWWPFAVRAFCAARNLENRGEGTAWGKRNDDRDFPGQLIPFGCLVDFKPIAPKPRRLKKGGLKNASERDEHHKADEVPTNDHWIFDEESGKLVRVHIEPRTKLFKADSVDAPIEHIRLTADRDTWVQYDEENGEMIHSVDWRYGPDSTKELKAPWTGETYFTVKPKEFDPLEDSDYEPMIQGRPITERTSTATCPLCRHRRLTLHLKRPNSGQCQSLEFSWVID